MTYWRNSILCYHFTTNQVIQDQGSYENILINCSDLPTAANRISLSCGMKVSICFVCLGLWDSFLAGVTGLFTGVVFLVAVFSLAVIVHLVIF